MRKRKKAQYRDAHFDSRVKIALARENTPKGKMFTRREITVRFRKALRRRK